MFFWVRGADHEIVKERLSRLHDMLVAGEEVSPVTVTQQRGFFSQSALFTVDSGWGAGFAVTAPMAHVRQVEAECHLRPVVVGTAGESSLIASGDRYLLVFGVVLDRELKRLCAGLEIIVASDVLAEVGEVPIVDENDWSRITQVRISSEAESIDIEVAPDDYRQMIAASGDQAVAVGPTRGRRSRTLWCYRANWFVANQEYTPDEAGLLAWAQVRRDEASISRLRQLRARDGAPPVGSRERIPEEVRLLVWERDGGCCVACGAQTDLQYDHIIPVARGGGNGVDNIQILCGSCNREKRDSIA